MIYLITGWTWTWKTTIIEWVVYVLWKLWYNIIWTAQTWLASSVLWENLVNVKEEDWINISKIGTIHSTFKIWFIKDFEKFILENCMEWKDFISYRWIIYG